MGSSSEKKKAARVEMSERSQRYSEELSSLLPGWRYVDSEVRIDGELVAELIGRVGERMVFVHALKGRKAEVIGEVMVRLSKAATDARRLAREYRTSAETPPLIILIVQGKTRGLLRGLGSLCPDPVLPFAERRLQTAGREARFLEELFPLESAPSVLEREASTPEEETASAVEESAQAGPGRDEVAARLDRIDSKLERVDEGGESHWLHDGEVLCSVSQDAEGKLIGRLGTDGLQHSLRSARGLEVFLDWVLAHLVELGDAGEREGLRDVELMPHPSEPLLTPEELAAFQE